MFLVTGLGGCLASTAALCACQACTCVSREMLRKSARLAYCTLFFAAVVCSWVLRDFAKPIIEKLPWILPGSGIHPSDRWYGQQAVYRLSMGNFLFFGFMAAALLGVKYKGDKRDQYLHHGGWLLKLALWLAFSALPFLFPNSLVNAYGWLARGGSGLFLILQMVILLDFVQTWNDAWVSMEDENYIYGLLGLTIGAFAGCAAIIGVLFYWFNPSAVDDCSFNVGITVFTIVLCVLVAMAPLHPSYSALLSVVVNRAQIPSGSLFPASVVALYCCYLAYSALQSEPHDYVCNGLGQRLNAASGTTLAVGMALALASVVWSALRMGSNTDAFLGGLEYGSISGAAEQPLVERNGGDEESLTSAGLDGDAGHSKTSERQVGRAMEDYEPVTYNYSWFHSVFALASMYIAMLMTGWGSGGEEKDLLDVGWTSMWVKIICQWATAGLYLWTLVAPALYPDRIFV